MCPEEKSFIIPRPVLLTVLFMHCLHIAFINSKQNVERYIGTPSPALEIHMRTSSVKMNVGQHRKSPKSRKHNLTQIILNVNRALLAYRSEMLS